MPQPTDDYGLCQCGCGQRTTIARGTNRSKGWEAGQPLRFVNGHHGRKRNLSDWANFYTETPGPLPTPCWLWNGTLDPKGYADRIHLFGKRVEAHRVLYERTQGPVPNGLELDHLCRVRSCVNPAHLEPVTHTENMRRGDVAKLNIEKARQIKRMDANGVPLREIAADFGVSYDCIRNITRRGRTWRDA
jgi:HNH endonuclease